MVVDSIEQLIGNTPMVRVKPKFLPFGAPTIYLKLEGNNPAGSVKDRPAYAILKNALQKKLITIDTPLVEATSGNTGIALAMVACGLEMDLTLVIPENMSEERMVAMRAYGAKIHLVSQKGGIEEARDCAHAISEKKKAYLIDQFNNNDNWKAHVDTTGPEIWQQTKGGVSHFFSAMGTTGTITGVSRYLKKKNSDIQICGVQPKDGSAIPGIRKWSPGYVPTIFQYALVDSIEEVSLEEAMEGAHWLAKTQGIFAGISSGGIMRAILKLCENKILTADDVIVGIVCDRGDRYTTTHFSKNAKALA